MSEPECIRCRTAREAVAVLPEPTGDGREVTPDLAAWIREHAPTPELAEALVAGIEARTAEGIEKYGRPLRAGDGRPTHAETLQELLDGLQYGHKAEMDGERIDTPVTVALLLLLCRKILRSNEASELADAARRTYEAYNSAGPRETAWKTWDGRPVPKWPDLPEAIREKWRAAVLAGTGGRR